VWHCLHIHKGNRFWWFLYC